MKLILTRHGKTIENENNITQGHLPGTLSERGEEQAKKLAERLKDVRLDAIYSSDLARTVNTAKEVIKFHPNTSIYYVEELRERHWGYFEGKIMRLISDPNQYKHTVESDEIIYNRAKNFLTKIYKLHPNDSVLFVAHGNINIFLTGIIQGYKLVDLEHLGENPNEIEILSNQKNTAISEFEITESKNKTILLNCYKHLK